MPAEIFFSWKRPTPEQQQICTARAGGFNFDTRFHGASAASTKNGGLQEGLTKNGFFINHSRVLLGSGPTTFAIARSALLSWRHFSLGWAFVDHRTTVKKGTRFCVCVKELLPWFMMPLQIAYVADSSDDSPPAASSRKASFGFGSGTLQGHILAGEESFSIEWDENDDVWYEIFSFSKPAHVLSLVGKPYVRFRQKFFAQQSTQAMLKHVATQQSIPD